VRGETREVFCAHPVILRAVCTRVLMKGRKRLGQPDRASRGSMINPTLKDKAKKYRDNRQNKRKSSRGTAAGIRSG